MPLFHISASSFSLLIIDIFFIFFSFSYFLRFFIHYCLIFPFIFISYAFAYFHYYFIIIAIFALRFSFRHITSRVDDAFLHSFIDIDSYATPGFHFHSSTTFESSAFFPHFRFLFFLSSLLTKAFT